MSNQIHHRCWSYGPGSSVTQPPEKRSASQSGRVAGHTAGDNFIPAGTVPGRSGGIPTINQRDVNREGQVPFKYTRTVSQQVIEGEATPEEIRKFLTADPIAAGFQVFPYPLSECIHCNDPQYPTPSDSPRLSTRHDTSNSFGHTVHFNSNRQSMAQGQR